jgi:hypothetical protein
MLHCRLAGCAPLEFVRERLSVTFPPGLPLPELRARPTCCAEAVTAPQQPKIQAASRIPRSLNLLARYLYFSIAFNIETPVFVPSERPHPLWAAGTHYSCLLRPAKAAGPWILHWSRAVHRQNSAHAYCGNTPTRRARRGKTNWVTPYGTGRSSRPEVTEQ